MASVEGDGRKQFFFVFFKEGLTRHVNLWIINENHFTVLSTAIQTSEQFIQSTAFQTITKMKRKTQHAAHLYHVVQDQKRKATHVQQS